MSSPDDNLRSSPGQTPSPDAADQPKVSPMFCHALRLTRGQNIKEEIRKYILKHKITAAFIISCVGSVTKVGLRFANSNDVRDSKPDKCNVRTVVLPLNKSILEPSKFLKVGLVSGLHLEVKSKLKDLASAALVGLITGSSFAWTY